MRSKPKAVINRSKSPISEEEHGLWSPKESSLSHSHTLTHTQSFPFVSSYCFFWVTVKTVNHENKKKKKKKKAKRKKEWNKRHASGRVRLTVAGQYYSFSSQWLVTDCLCYTPKNCQGDKHQSSTRPWPLDATLSLISIFVFLPSLTSATLLSASRLRYPRQVTSSGGGGGEMVYKCTSCVVVLLYTAWWGQSDAAEGGILPPAGGGQDCYIYSERPTGGGEEEAEVGR